MVKVSMIYVNCLGFVFTSVVCISRLVLRTTCLGLDMHEKHIFHQLVSENVYSHPPLTRLIYVGTLFRVVDNGHLPLLRGTRCNATQRKSGKTRG
jgi:hypothetical protein